MRGRVEVQYPTLLASHLSPKSWWAHKLCFLEFGEDACRDMQIFLWECRPDSKKKSVLLDFEKLPADTYPQKVGKKKGESKLHENQNLDFEKMG